MPTNPDHDSATSDWPNRLRGQTGRPVEWLTEKAIRLVSLSAIVLIFLIFAFILKESIPVFLGQLDNEHHAQVIPPDEMDRHSPAELRRYLELSEAEFTQLDNATLRLMLEVKAEAAAEAPQHPDAAINTTSWRYLVPAHQWSGYEEPVHVWQPVSDIPKYNIMPLLVGSLKTTLTAILFAVPLALGAAIYVSQLAGARVREFLKPAIEMLAGIPSVVLGFFALIVMASVMQHWFNYGTRLNTLVAGIALGLAIVPLVFSIAEDALSTVPMAYRDAGLALGATPWQVAWQIVVPAALPGIFAAVLLGFGRAIGETMIVLMASGNASIMSWSLLDSTRTITATIAAELAEAVFGGNHYRIIFMLGTVLFAITFVTNLLGEVIIHRLKARLEGSR